MKINRKKYIKITEVKKVKIQKKEESGDRNGTWLETCNCCGGRGTDSWQVRTSGCLLLRQQEIRFESCADVPQRCGAAQRLERMWFTQFHGTGNIP